ncbi:MAG: hypothetical protein WBV94_34035 [Blastocatellia bacterium]
MKRLPIFRRLPIFSLCLITLLVSSAFARPAQNAKVAGEWDITVESPRGKNTSLLVIKQEGDKLTGAMKSPRGERPLDSVSVKGNEITFVMTFNNQGQDIVITYKGKVEKDAMSGEADFGGFATGPWSAVPHKEGAMAAPAAAPAAASDTNITGVWNVTVETPNGTGSPVFTLKQEGETLTGSYKGQFGEAPVAGSVKGTDVKFTLKINAQGQDLDITYMGKIDGKDSMSGKVILGGLGEGTWTAKKKS